MKLQSFPVVISLLVLLHILSPTSGDLDSDRQALLHFASAVPHVRKLNWNSNASVCTSWIGITCSDDGTRVTAIHLPGFGLSGPIPGNSIGKLDALRVLSLRSNYLNGNLPSDIPSIPSLQSLYLQHNNFSGMIPTNLSTKLNVLDLSFNSFRGNISLTDENLPRLTVLNLQFNSFSGGIPDLNLPRLKLLNLSHNMLNGSIPTRLRKFPISSFLGNSLLCGPPLTDCSVSSPSPSPIYFPSPPTIPPKQEGGKSKKLGAAAIIPIAIGGSSFLILLVLVFFFCCLKKKTSNGSRSLKAKATNGGRSAKPEDFGSGVQEAEKNKLVFFEGCSFNFDLEDLLRASAEVLGKGSYGTAYKAVLDEGVMVVVKRLREVGVAKREFEQQMEVVGRVGQHPNIVPLRAYYFSKDEKLLVCDHYPTGSLSALLHGNRGTGRVPLDWDARVKISLGTAKGIAHIHSEGGAKFTHGNIKASNVLLTQDLTGRVSDYGLTSVTNILSTRGIGYRAPEVIETRKVTQKSDVYSFGVLLLEMLTGRSPLKSSGHDDVVDLPRWVRSVVREEWTAEVFDPDLMRFQNVEEEMVQMLQIALACVTKAPDMRPTMDEVVRMIEEIRQSELDNRPSSDDNRSKDSNVNTP
ncbi:probable inactive receptor kinase At5g58300 [Rhododendron vialii]|uniref:probable inactive receptor kinase At5g58300 n=1 Tax=Rhododendron vialii TaxID=182163 RepID=UPI00265FC093|nr:probable inactive receptor kinase At5g58300 [Rhododendron vialii]XP_058183740.1 probable inactive receptor kinase At5g58300 [Rhododendron vialii]XP_058183741.1 probable inactive receptor kinase At5g58300 [Rhododendron vialii]XP_058183742.1 probable inactive receptor kinase At5g58300 [Rhododendron vialii]XP_058183743.1 probable inactive receptor kinase At5g58300 [Rhododendron vialii]XP_058183744.1 probable inactive receptor kinase At5g58300 [Rhododendron vialii]XP_058183745.1 probable inact